MRDDGEPARLGAARAARRGRRRARPRASRRPGRPAPPRSARSRPSPVRSRAAITSSRGGTPAAARRSPAVPSSAATGSAASGDGAHGDEQLARAPRSRAGARLACAPQDVPVVRVPGQVVAERRRSRPSTAEQPVEHLEVGVGQRGQQSGALAGSGAASTQPDEAVEGQRPGRRPQLERREQPVVGVDERRRGRGCARSRSAATARRRSRAGPAAGGGSRTPGGAGRWSPRVTR